MVYIGYNKIFFVRAVMLVCAAAWSACAAQLMAEEQTETTQHKISSSVLIQDGMEDDGWLAHFHFQFGIRSLMENEWEVASEHSMFAIRYDVRRLGGTSSGAPWSFYPEAELIFTLVDETDNTNQDWRMSTQTLAGGMAWAYDVTSTFGFHVGAGLELINADLRSDSRSIDGNDITFGVYVRPEARWQVTSAMALNAAVRTNFTGSVQIDNSEKASLSAFDATIGISFRF